MIKFLSVLLIGMFSFSAQSSERWVIKNPKQTSSLETLRNLNSHSFLNLKNQYLILDLEGRTTKENLIHTFSADSVFPDVQIVVDKPEEVRSIPDARGWHVEFLEYSNLNSEFEGQDVIVAVIDTGVDYNHYALMNKMWKNKKEIPDNFIDDDGNGLVDDYHGYNFIDNSSNPLDTSGHGTHCAGIVVADLDSATKAQGVAPRAQIMPLLIINNNYTGFLSGAANAVKYATDNGAKVLSNSWRVYNSWEEYVTPEGVQMLDEALAYAGDHEVIFVAAAGNEKKNLDVTNLENPIIPLSFKNHKNMIGVASVSFENKEETLSGFSNYGVSSVSIAAPGNQIYSTLPNGRWSMMSGTSMATPIIAGTLARGISKGYNMKQALKNLNKTSKKNAYWDQYISDGRVDIKKYLE